MRHFFIPPFPTSLSRTFNRFKKNYTKIRVKFCNIEIDTTPRHRFQTCPKKKIQFVGDAISFSGQLNLLQFSFWHVHTATCDLTGIRANSWVSLNDAKTPSVPSKNTKQIKTVWLKSKLQFICIEVEQICIFDLFDLFDITMCMQEGSLSVRNMRLCCSLPDLITRRFHLRLLNISSLRNKTCPNWCTSFPMVCKSISLKEIKVRSDQIRCG